MRNQRRREASGRPFTVLVALDLREPSVPAFRQAARIARRIAGSQLHALQVTEVASEESMRHLGEQLRTYLNEEAVALGDLDGQRAGVHVRAGRPAREIVQLATDLGADLIVLGTNKRPHMKILVLGSVAEKIMRDAPCPVIVAGPNPPEREAHEPAIEPPCADCLSVRAATGGKSWWCAHHAEHHLRAHHYSYHRELPFVLHDSEVEPTGTPVRD